MKKVRVCMLFMVIYMAIFCNILADTKNVDDVKISSPSAIVIDTLNGRVLYEKDGYSKRNIASLT